MTVAESTDQEIIDNIFIAFELEKVDRENDYSWKLYFDDYEFLKNRSLKGHNSLDTS